VRRSLAALVALIAVLVMGAPASAAPPDLEPLICPRTASDVPGTTFEVKGDQQAFIGGWKAGAHKASLCFRGADVAGDTTILASWMSPWSKTGKYEFQGGYDFENVNPANDVMYSSGVRFQLRGGEWSGWFAFSHPQHPPLGGGGVGFGMGILFGGGGKSDWKPPPIRWQWHLVVELTAPAALDMQAALHAK
jgi:hypothetical protein